MRLVADLHIHSRFSLATSPRLDPVRLERWARVKGIGLVGTGDCTHPAWLAELRGQLEPAEEGFFALKDEFRRVFDSGDALAEGLPDPATAGPDSAAPERPPRFVLTGEVCTIYSRGGRTRKVHHLVLLPDFAAAAAFQARLSKVGSIASDGRPILGIDSRELFSLLLESDDRSILVPAHIWTPWFSVLGARSGFDSIEECYGDLAPRIGAIETGLSSNPPMNWSVSALDRYAIISNSDAHSPEKLGREATVLDMEVSWGGLGDALGGGGPRGNIVETIEFFPQEGKYHYDGHRACGVAQSPEESARHGGICPVCGKPLTPGVLRRVSELADRPVDESAPCPRGSSGTNRRPYRSFIPLKELLAELLATGEGSKKVAAAYTSLVERAGSEFALLGERGLSEIERLRTPGVSGELLALAVDRMRTGRVSITPGYDGEYGSIRAFFPGEKIEARGGAGLFGEDADKVETPLPARKSAVPRGTRGETAALPDANAAAPAPPPFPLRLDAAQEAAVRHPGGPALIVAGPGTGKTAVLALRIARLVEGGTEPSSILALTFTNKAAEELRERIGRVLGTERAEAITASTFHSFCRSLLRERADEASLAPDFSILDEEERSSFLAAAAGGGKQTRKLGAYIEERKRFLLLPGEKAPRLGPGAPEGLAELAAELGLPAFDGELDAGYAAYRDALRKAQGLDFDDLVAGTVRLLAARPEVRSACRARRRWIFVDEYQDVNFAQYALIRLLAPDRRPELCVIGDPNQAIYGFRGADRRFIDRFLADYPEAAVHRLVRSFRCAPDIIGAAGRLVGEKLQGADPGSAVVLTRAEYPTGKSEAEGIAREIDRLIGGTRFFAMDSGVAPSAGASSPRTGEDAETGPALRGLGECAILVRASALAPALEKALLDHGLPYRLIGEKPWWDEEPCRSALSMLRAAATSGLHEKLAGLSPSEAVKAAFGLLSESAHGKETRHATPDDAPARLEALAAGFADLASFLDGLALGSPQDGWEARAERVSIMTIHAAKGLEFDHVFVAGLEDGILPFTLFEQRQDTEEERRLLYVAMTRARVGLHLSWARSRSIRGRELSLPPSRFLAELADLVPILDSGPRRPRDPQLGLFKA
jgi:uncharacterized protein (TIGR00375 family)